ncbi:flagellar hook-length control protein FliK [Alphaproteobacteria bacterium LSUCC0684]
MTTISTIPARAADLAVDSGSVENTPMDGAFAIFAAVLATMSAQEEALEENGLTTGTDAPELNAEDLLDQIMADESVSPYIDLKDRKDLLPLLDKILENPDQIASIVDLEDVPAIWADLAQARMKQEMPADTAEAMIPAPNSTQVAGQGLAAERIFTASLISTPVSAPRGRYDQPRNPVQALAAIIRKITPPKAQAEIDPSVYGPFPKNSAAADAVKAQLQAHKEINPVIATTEGKIASSPVSAETAAPRVTDHKVYGPFPENSTAADAVKAQLQAHKEINPVIASAPRVTDPAVYGPFAKEAAGTDEVKAHVQKLDAPAPGVPEVPFVKPALLKAASLRMTGAAADHEMLAAESQGSTQQASSLRPSLAPNGAHNPAQASATTFTMSGGENGGQFRQNQQSPSGLDTRMGLDQGRDARLFRLSVSDHGWQDRLIRHIHASRNDGMDEKITVQLQPRTLGRLTLNISVIGNTTSVQIVASTAEAAAMLQEQEAKLQQAFDQNGLRLSNMQTSTQHGGQQQGQEAGGRNTRKREAENASKMASSDENSSTKIQENANNGQINILA